MTYEKHNSDLKAQWEKRLPDHYEGFIWDGIIDTTCWNKGEKILFLLKEAHGGGDWDIAQQIRTDGGMLKVSGTASPTMHYRLIEWAYAIQQALRGQDLTLADMQTDRENGYPQCKQAMLSSAYMNIKKVDGISSSNWADLSEQLTQHQDLLQQQLSLIAPKVIYCGFTYEVSKDILFPGATSVGNSPWLRRWQDTLLIDGWHPANRQVGKDSWLEIYQAVGEGLER